MDAYGNLDRDRLQWLANNPHYQADPWRFVRCLNKGNCAVCGKVLDSYDSKWHHPDGRMVCGFHWLWTSDVLPPTTRWMYYTDG